MMPVVRCAALGVVVLDTGVVQVANAEVEQHGECEYDAGMTEGEEEPHAIGRLPSAINLRVVLSIAAM